MQITAGHLDCQDMCVMCVARVAGDGCKSLAGQVYLTTMTEFNNCVGSDAQPACPAAVMPAIVWGNEAGIDGIDRSRVLPIEEHTAEALRCSGLGDTQHCAKSIIAKCK